MKKASGLSIFAIIILSIGFASQSANAQDIDGTFHLTMNVPLLRYTNMTIEAEDSDNEWGSENTEVGFAIPGIGLGYSVTNNFVLGVGFSPSYSTYELEDGGENETIMILLGPFFQYIFSVPIKFKPYIQLALGVVIRDQSSLGWGNNDLETSQADFAIGATIGAHGFATDTFSIGPFVTFTYIAGSGEIESLDTDFQDSGYALTLGAALAGWI